MTNVCSLKKKVKINTKFKKKYFKVGKFYKNANNIYSSTFLHLADFDI